MRNRAAAKSIEVHPAARPRPVARIVCGADRRRTGRNTGQRLIEQFAIGEAVGAVALIRNDGMYPHKDIGEPLVYPGDAGTVRESWRFLGEVYYTVEFTARSVFVIMRGREMTPIGTTSDPG